MGSVVVRDSFEFLIPRFKEKGGKSMEWLATEIGLIRPCMWVEFVLVLRSCSENCSQGSLVFLPLNHQFKYLIR